MLPMGTAHSRPVTFEVVAAKPSDITLTDVFITNAADERLQATTAGAKVVVQ